MTLHVTIKKSLKTEVLAAHTAGKAIGIIVLLSKESKSYQSAITTSCNLAASTRDSIRWIRYVTAMSLVTKIAQS